MDGRHGRTSDADQRTALARWWPEMFIVQCVDHSSTCACFSVWCSWKEAADALVCVAEIHEKNKEEQLDAANKYAEAGLCMARVANDEAIKLLDMAITIHTQEGRLGAAARVWRDLGELEEEEENLQAAIDAWRKAADCHESEGTLANALQCYLHVAELHVKEYQFKKASKLYEKCAEICMDKAINKGSLRDYFYNALLCQFVVSARKGVRHASKHHRRTHQPRDEQPSAPARFSLTWSVFGWCLLFSPPPRTSRT